MSTRAAQDNSQFPIKLHRLVEGAVGGLLLNALLFIAALVIGLWIGFDLRLLSFVQAIDRLHLLALALLSPLPIAALGALYHARIHALLLPLPISARTHFYLGIRLYLSHWAWIMIAIGAGIGAGFGRGWIELILLILFPTFIVISGGLISYAMAGFCAPLSDANGRLYDSIRESLAGPFSTPRHAPFFYLPAFAFFIATMLSYSSFSSAIQIVLKIKKQLSLEPALLFSFILPLFVGVIAFLLSLISFSRHGLKTIARVIEEKKTVYGGKPAPADPPYGSLWARLFPRTIAAHFAKELREQSRAHPALWPVIGLLMFASLIYAINVGEPLKAAPLIAALSLIWVASVPLRRSPILSGAAFVQTLPLSTKGIWLGRLFALAWPTAHLLLALVIGLYVRDSSEAGIKILLMLSALAFSTVLSATAATSPKYAADRQWGIAARLVGVLIFIAALILVEWPLASFAISSTLFFVSLILGLKE